MSRNDSDEYFALFMLDVRTAFFDIHRILQVAKEQHSDNSVSIVAGRDVCKNVAQAIAQESTDVEV